MVNIEGLSGSVDHVVFVANLEILHTSYQVGPGSIVLNGVK